MTSFWGDPDTGMNASQPQVVEVDSTEAEFHPADGDSSDHPPTGNVGLGNGHVLVIPHDYWSAFMTGDLVMGAITARAQEVVEIADASAEVEGAKYQLRPVKGTQRNRVYITAANYKAVEDQNAHDTLRNAAEQWGRIRSPSRASTPCRTACRWKWRSRPDRGRGNDPWLKASIFTST